jgi:hypothetical protein
MLQLDFIFNRPYHGHLATIMQDIKSSTEKHAPAVSRAISMAMQIRWYGAKHITQYGRSRATLNNTGRRHWVSIGPILPLRTPWLLILE